MDKKFQSRFVATGTAGALEMVIFHPIDTMAKRLMNNKAKIGTSIPLMDVLFEGGKTPLQAYKSLFPGIGFGAMYKVTQRIYKFGGQPYVKEFAVEKLQPKTKLHKTLCDGFAGMLMGMGEVALLPLDVMKIKLQTNPDYRNISLWKAIGRESIPTLYAGWHWTMARNAPGSFALFGGNAVVKEYWFHLKDHRTATFFQTSVSSAFGSVCSILVACPLDVVKTRIQSGSHGNGGGMHIVTNICKDEGMTAFFKGAIPKVVTVGPKLIFSFTIAQYLMAMFEKGYADNH
eukprot:GEMP01038513.1.p1 GENE.GEMP01038513.1~~GEMP01038513.1.p1  ORF type:complete len:288 (+),score=49.33 GEMP01038513.1:55-918(+)